MEWNGLDAWRLIWLLQQNVRERALPPLAVRIPGSRKAQQARKHEESERAKPRRSRHLAEHARLRHVRHVDEDVVGGVAVEGCAEALLVEVVTDETDAAAEDEEAVERTNLETQHMSATM